ncbi:hypothetical protein LINPERPRIM_LOCUS28432 [Linum perenne]
MLADLPSFRRFSDPLPTPMPCGRRSCRPITSPCSRVSPLIVRLSLRRRNSSVRFAIQSSTTTARR